MKLKTHNKLNKIKADLHKKEMQEVRWTPDLTQTSRYNMKISKSMVNLRRQKSITRYKEKSDRIKQQNLKTKQSEKEGCTFSPQINMKSKRLKRNFTDLIASYDCKKYTLNENLFYL